MKTLIIAANWKLNKTEGEAIDFVKSWWPQVKSTKHELVLFPSAILLSLVSRALAELSAKSKVTLGPQNISAEPKGAFTGENSLDQAKSVGSSIALVGHSERRQLFGETDQQINRKVKAILDQNLKCMLCVGETLPEREAGQTNAVVNKQLAGALDGVTDFKNLIVAYEPVWAIGTGKVATPEQAEEAHLNIYDWISKNRPSGAKVPVLYGGSVKSDNAKTLSVQKHIDGFLVGGASLDANEFAKICLV